MIHPEKGAKLLITFVICSLTIFVPTKTVRAANSCANGNGTCRILNRGFCLPGEKHWPDDDSSCTKSNEYCCVPQTYTAPTPTTTPSGGGGGGGGSATCKWPTDTKEYDGIETGLGCIPTEPEGLVTWFLTYATRLAGGIAFALLLYGGILFITAQGDEDKVEEAQKTITSALTGLLVIFFATLILKVIGYDILGLPGWGPGGEGLEIPGGS